MLDVPRLRIYLSGFQSGSYGFNPLPVCMGLLVGKNGNETDYSSNIAVFPVSFTHILLWIPDTIYQLITASLNNTLR